VVAPSHGSLGAEMMTTILKMMILAKKMMTMDLKNPMGMILVKKTTMMDQKDPMEILLFETQ
jgi:hypothetical protein